MYTVHVLSVSNGFAKHQVGSFDAAMRVVSSTQNEVAYTGQYGSAVYVYDPHGQRVYNIML